MIQTWQIVLFELKLYFSSKSFWIIALLANLYTWAAFFFAGQVMSGVAQMFMPLLLFLAAEVVTRGKRENFAALSVSLPFPSFGLQLGRALSVLILFVLLGLELVGSMLIVAGTALPVYVSFSAVGAFVVKYLLACINVIGVTFFAASITNHLRYLYSLLLGWWLTGIFLAGNTGTILPIELAAVSFSSISGFGGNPSEVSGLFPNEKLIQAIMIAQTVFSTVLLVGALLIENIRQQKSQHILKVNLLIWMMIFTAGGCFIWQSYRVNDVESNAVMRLDAAGPLGITQSPAMEASDYNLMIQLIENEHFLSAKAQIKLKKTGDVTPRLLEFTLLDYLKVAQVINLATGEPLDWQQQGTYLCVIPPASLTDHKEVNIEITYSGHVWEWTTDLYGRPVGLDNFVAAPITYLRGGAPWYPVVGRQAVYTASHYTLPWSNESRQVIQRSSVLHSPANVHLTVDIDSGATAISNLTPLEKQINGKQHQQQFFASNCRNVFLLAGPYEVAAINIDQRFNVDFYYFPGHIQNLSSIAKGYSQMISYYEGLIPRDMGSGDAMPKTYVIFEAPRFLSYDNLMRTNNAGFTDAVPIPEAVSLTKALQSSWWSQPSGRVLTQARILNLWWPNCFSQAQGTIADGLALYMYTLYMESKQGEKFYHQASEYWRTYDDRTPEYGEALNLRGLVVRDVFLLLDTIRQSKLGEAGVKQFLRLIHSSYQHKRSIEIADITAALEEIGAPALGKNNSRDNFREICEDLARVLAKQEDHQLQGTLSIKLNWDFSPEIKVLR
ncbi:hypothetical protein SPFL3102_03085 [Sporomusaceae bacterium FL31]|nr:hypothetical protein SPFL3101_00959 [Sporomusaceae bacterium FL31]GCE35249.1 hypothetical protein SPFL3102_03085 [Sporomusaceae bacterium]